MNNKNNYKRRRKSKSPCEMKTYGYLRQRGVANFYAITQHNNKLLYVPMFKYEKDRYFRVVLYIINKDDVLEYLTVLKYPEHIKNFEQVVIELINVHVYNYKYFRYTKGKRKLHEALLKDILISVNN